MQAVVPNRLSLGSRTLNFTGNGRTRGSYAYMDPGRLEVVELFFAEVVQVGPHFGLARIADNPQMPLARVDHHGSPNGQVRVGEVLLGGPVVFDGGKPRLASVWPAHVRPARVEPAFRVVSPVRPPNPAGQLGRIEVIRHAYGFIKPLVGNGTDVFFHMSEARGFSPSVGQVVRFRPEIAERGLKAVDLCLA